jgi:hypothetical protein
MAWKLRTKQRIRRKYFSFLFKFRSSNLNRKLRQVSLIVACGSVNLKLIFRHNSRLLKFRFLELIFFTLSHSSDFSAHLGLHVKYGEFINHWLLFSSFDFFFRFIFEFWILFRCPVRVAKRRKKIIYLDSYGIYFICFLNNIDSESFAESYFHSFC